MSSLGIWVFALPSIRQTWQILLFQWRLSWPNYDMENILMIRFRSLSFHLLQAKAGLLHRQKYFCKHLWQQHLVASPTLKGLNMDKVKTNSNQKHTKSSLSHNNSTCYFSSSVLRGRCWSWWPRVKIGLKWMCLIALNNLDNKCWLGSILIGKIFLKIIDSFRNEKLYHTRTWKIYLCCLNGTFPLLELSMTAYPSENLGTIVQNIAFIIFQDGFCKFTIQLIDLTISNAAKEDIIHL